MVSRFGGRRRDVLAQQPRAHHVPALRRRRDVRAASSRSRSTPVASRPGSRASTPCSETLVNAVPRLPASAGRRTSPGSVFRNVWLAVSRLPKLPVPLNASRIRLRRLARHVVAHRVGQRVDGVVLGGGVEACRAPASPVMNAMTANWLRAVAGGQQALRLLIEHRGHRQRAGGDLVGGRQQRVVGRVAGQQVGEVGRHLVRRQRERAAAAGARARCGRGSAATAASP